MKFIKRSLLMMLLICLICASSLLNMDAAAASGKCGDNITWTVENNILTLTGSGEMYDYSDHLQDRPYHSPGIYSIHTVKISKGITHIGNNAFAEFSSLQYVEMPDVLTIGDRAFYTCRSLTQISGNNVTRLGNNAFEHCVNLVSVSFPKLETIGRESFFQCRVLLSVNFPNATSAGEGAFKECIAMTSAKLPALTALARNMFESCSSLKTFDITPHLVIPSGCFHSCSALTSLDFSNVVTIENAAFSYCTSLHEVTAPKLTTLGGSAFSNCSALQSADFPLITYIADFCFSYCSSLNTVNAVNAKSISVSAFRDSGLRSAYFPLVETVSQNGFLNCTRLKEAIFSSATNIDIAAFYNCTSLESITVSTELKRVSSNAFFNCSALKTVYVLPTQEEWDLTYYSGNDAFINANMELGSAPVTMKDLPATSSVAKNQLLSLNAPVSGLALAYQWQICYPNTTEWIDIDGEVNPSAYSSKLVYGPVQMTDTGTQFRLMILTGTGETLTSNATTLVVTPFADVDGGAFYMEPLMWALDKGITTGTSDTAFSPNNPCTRGQVVTFLWRAAGSPEPISTENPFSDVKEGPFYKAILWAVEQGITTGYSDGTFRPGASCTRGQIATFLWRAAGSPEPTSTHNPFSDVSDGPFYKAILWAVEQGITTGYTDGTFRPSASCTRAHIVTFLYRSYN